jgi:hypothetical protein
MVAEARLTVTELTGTRETTTLADPLCPSLVATIVAVPAETAETTPELLTEAMLVLPDDQVMGRPVSTFPFASFVTAVACVVAPTNREDEASVTLTLATGTRLTAIAADPFLPSLVATIELVPAASALTTPPPSTVATVVLVDDQIIERPLNTLLFASLSVATA